MAEVVREGTVWRAGACHADTALLLIILDVVGAEEEIVPAVLLDDRWRPHRPTRPFHARGVDDAWMLIPGDQIGRREGVEKDLLVVPVRIRRIDPILSGENMDFGIGVPTRKNRIARALRR